MSRYAQQIIVPEVGANGQQKIAAARVLLIGAGGLGTPAAAYLAAAGVGTIGLADGDTIALSNLPRQFLYNESEAGQPKATLLAIKLKQQNPSILINTYPVMINEGNVHSIINEYDIVCDCTDNAATRILVDKLCGELKKPLVYAVVKDWEGYVTVLHHRRNITLDTIFSHSALLENAALNCSVSGIINTTCGIAGSMQAGEVLKIILGINSDLDGGICCFNTAGPVFKMFTLQKI